MRDITDATFRSAPRYELVEFSRLTKATRATLHPMERDPEFFGVLRPSSDPTLVPKAVCRNTALLWLTLATPGPLPAYLRAHDPQANRSLVEMVLDGVLEVEVDGEFLSGPEAADWIHESEVPAGTERLARLSIDALQYAGALELDEVTAITRRLYCYNRHPLSPEWRRRFPSDDTVLNHLGVTGRGRCSRLLASDWVMERGSRGWLVWHTRRPAAIGQRVGQYKLYLSPAPDAAAQTFEVLVETITAMRGECFKVGNGLSGLLRPDKMIAYFPEEEALFQFATALRPKVAGLAVQGVPFTAGIGGDGLLSWGVDPPEDGFSLPWEHADSWRTWVAGRLAESLRAAQGVPAVEGWRYALQRIAAHGVNPATWTWTPR